MSWDGTERRKSTCPHGACREPETAAENAVRKVFSIVGIDIDKPDSVERFREDLRFSAHLRKRYDRAGMLIWTLIIGSTSAWVIYKLTGWKP